MNFEFKLQSTCIVWLIYAELKLRKDSAILPENVITLALEDPKGQVGSGGATLNALLVVTEYMSVQAGYTVLHSIILSQTWLAFLFPSSFLFIA